MASLKWSRFSSGFSYLSLRASLPSRTGECHDKIWTLGVMQWDVLPKFSRRACGGAEWATLTTASSTSTYRGTLSVLTVVFQTHVGSITITWMAVSPWSDGTGEGLSSVQTWTGRIRLQRCSVVEAVSDPGGPHHWTKIHRYIYTSLFFTLMLSVCCAFFFLRCESMQFWNGQWFYLA